MKQKQLTLRFTGNKKQLHKQLKLWCLKADRTMNGYIIELVEKELEQAKEKGK